MRGSASTRTRKATAAASRRWTGCRRPRQRRMSYPSGSRAMTSSADTARTAASICVHRRVLVAVAQILQHRCRRTDAASAAHSRCSSGARAGCARAQSRPSMSTWPSVGSKNRQTRFTSVDLARAGLAHDGDGRPRRDLQVEVLEHVLLSVRIAERDVAELDVAVRAAPSFRVFGWKLSPYFCDDLRRVAQSSDSVVQQAL